MLFRSAVYFRLLGGLCYENDNSFFSSSADLDEYSRAIIEGTTIGDCEAIHPNCPVDS